MGLDFWPLSSHMRAFRTADCLLSLSGFQPHTRTMKSGWGISLCFFSDSLVKIKGLKGQNSEGREGLLFGLLEYWAVVPPFG